MYAGKWEETRGVALKLEWLRIRDPNGYREVERRIAMLLGEAPAAPPEGQNPKERDCCLHRY